MILKVCGMREPDNIRAVEQLGVTWMGFIFYPRSSRYVGEAKPNYLPRSARRIGVFVNETVENIVARVGQFGLQGVQLHGNESPAFCRELRRALQAVRPEEAPLLIKAFSIGKESDLQATDAYASLCDYFLFDTPCHSYGGSGKSFDWQLLAAYEGDTPFLLSGGIGCEHIEALHCFAHPRWAGIDLNSRFETRPAYKDADLLNTFIHEFNRNNK